MTLTQTFCELNVCVCVAKMDAAEFREFGKKTIDWIVDYKENLKDISPITKTEPGYLAEELPGN